MQEREGLKEEAVKGPLGVCQVDRQTSETLVNFYQTTRCYNPGDSHLPLYNLSVFRFSSCSSTSEEHLMALFMSICLSRFSYGCSQSA
jgi:hypothetical protein